MGRNIIFNSRVSIHHYAPYFTFATAMTFNGHCATVIAYGHFILNAHPLQVTLWALVNYG